MLHAYSHDNFMLELRIVKLHRKTILQQTPSSDTPTSAAPISFFLIWYGGHRVKKKFFLRAITSYICKIDIPYLYLWSTLYPIFYNTIMEGNFSEFETLTIFAIGHENVKVYSSGIRFKGYFSSHAHAIAAMHHIIRATPFSKLD